MSESTMGQAKMESESTMGQVKTDDLISRQAAKDAFMKATADGDKVEFCWWVLDGVPTADQLIPCSERLPSKADHTDDMVLVCYRNGSVRFNTYMNGWVQGNPVAWMPLPKPYKEEERSEE